MGSCGPARHAVNSIRTVEEGQSVQRSAKCEGACTYSTSHIQGRTENREKEEENQCQRRRKVCVHTAERACISNIMQTIKHINTADFPNSRLGLKCGFFCGLL